MSNAVCVIGCPKEKSTVLEEGLFNFQVPFILCAYFANRPILFTPNNMKFPSE